LCHGLDLLFALAEVNMPPATGFIHDRMSLNGRLVQSLLLPPSTLIVDHRMHQLVASSTKFDQALNS
jgi:hypothetical protein